MQLPVYTPDGSRFEEKAFDIPALEEGKGVQALRDVLIALQANLRQGNACAKTRGEVSGTGKKIYRQKGTGNARHGDRQAPIFVGGGVVFGPRPRDFSKGLNRKVKRLALNRALLDLAGEGNLKLIQAFELNAPKTRELVQVLRKVGIEGKKVLLVDDAYAADTLLSARNIDKLNCVEADSLNPLDLSKAACVLMTVSALDKLINRLSAKELSHAAA